jgi:uncharacterized protein YkwD
MDRFLQRSSLGLVACITAAGLVSCIAADDEDGRARPDLGVAADGAFASGPNNPPGGGTSGGTTGSDTSTVSCSEGKACGNKCVDISSNAKHCGKCGHQCPPGGFYCSSGTCRCIDSGLSTCGNKCVDTQSNAFHCGKCGHSCPGGQICENSQCQRLTEIEAVVRETNKWRSQQVRCKDGSGIHSPTHDVKPNPQLHQAAQYHAENMARAGFFAHEQCGSPPRGACQACSKKQTCYGPGWRVETQSSFSGSSAVGENIAKGQPSPKEAVQAWIDSETGHCNNLMNGKWDRIGVGYAEDSNGTPYWVQVFGVSE